MAPLKILDFVTDILDLVNRYNLNKYVDTFIDKGKFVKLAVSEIESSEWNFRMNIEPNFNMFKTIHPSCKPHAVWKVAQLNPSLRLQVHYVISLCCHVRTGPFTSQKL